MRALCTRQAMAMTWAARCRRSCLTIALVRMPCQHSTPSRVLRLGVQLPCQGSEPCSAQGGFAMALLAATVCKGQYYMWVPLQEH